MKIKAVNTYLVRPRWGFVEICTDDGQCGWGEAVLEGHAATVQACVEEMSEYLIGADPRRIEDIWTTLYRAGFYRGGGVLMSAIAGIDQALWDIKGTVLGVPCYQLLGGKFRSKMRSYASQLQFGWCDRIGPYGKPEEYAEITQYALDQGAVSYTHLTLPTTPYV